VGLKFGFGSKRETKEERGRKKEREEIKLTF